MTRLGGKGDKLDSTLHVGLNVDAVKIGKTYKIIMLGIAVVLRVGKVLNNQAHLLTEFLVRGAHGIGNAVEVLA